MLKLLRALAFWLLPAVAAAQFTPAEPPEPAREFRGAWIASVFNLHWPSRAGLPAATQQRELRALLDRAVELRLNAVILQVRPSCDALYASNLEPWSAVLTGKMGVSPGYDPLAFAIEEAHARGLELHAWFNPFRALTSSNAAGAASSHVTRTHPEWVRTYGGQSYLDPGEPAARAYVQSVMLDVLRRYDVDGLHIDDYFYPYPVKDKAGAVLPFNDAATYRQHGGGVPLDDWRRANIDGFVSGLYRAIKAEKRWVKFGISPFGIWRPHVPPSIEARLDAYAQLYGDSRKWLQEGWCDYFAPQLYWSIDPPAQSFPVLLEWWRAQNRQGRHFWPGIADDRIGPERPATEITRQIALTRAEGARNAGVIHWEIKSLLSNRGGVGELLKSGPYASPALVPACPWLAGIAAAPAAPKLTREGNRLTWKAPATPETIRWWALQARRSGSAAWTLTLLPGDSTSAPIPPEATAVALRAVDRTGISSPAAVIAVTP